VSDHGSNKKVANSLVALSSAAVLAVYAAGYLRTRAAADRFTVQAESRPGRPNPTGEGGRPAIPAPATAPASPKPQGEDRPKPLSDAAPAPVAAVPKPEPIRKKPRATAAVSAPKPSGDAKQAAPPAVPAIPAVEPSPVVAPPPPPEPPPAPAKPVYKDGTYLGWGTSRHGDIQAQVVIEDGRIKAATIAQCLTRYSCNVIVNLPPQVAQRQSPETDYVSGATQSTNAFYYAVVDALSKAK
jgi:uncharacterized protein with FMN-binding domain